MALRSVRLGRLAPALALVACLVTSRVAVAADGEWVPLGTPARLRSPMLWDSAGHRLVAIDAGVASNADSVRGVWELRPGTPWRRLTVPAPPGDIDLAVDPIVADPARPRFLAFATRGNPSQRQRTWALDFSGTPAWVALDATPQVPWGPVLVDPRGEALWVMGDPLTGGPPELWTRSLADTGQWRMSRTVSAWPVLGERARWVEPLQGRFLVLGTRADLPESTAVYSLPLTGADGWTLEPGPVPPELRYLQLQASRGDRAGTQQRFLVGYVDTPSRWWRFDYGQLPRWTFAGSLETAFANGAFASGSDTLWAHGAYGARYQGGVSTLAFPLVPFGFPAFPVNVAGPFWPPYATPALFARDRVGQRWLYGRMGITFTYGTLPADSLWELTLAGERATWRRLRALGTPPATADVMRWANDEEGRTIYVVAGPEGAGWPPVGGLPTLHALHYDGTPRWESLALGPPVSALTNATQVFFDPVRRELVLVVGHGTDTPGVYCLAVDGDAGWQAPPVIGALGPLDEPWDSALDASRDRALYRAWNGDVVALEFGDTLRWRAGHVAQCPEGGPTCLSAEIGQRGVFDPIERRMVLLGGLRSALERLVMSMYAVAAADTLGPVRRLEPFGDPGLQTAPLAGYDETRDAIVLFGAVNPSAPSLYEFRFDRGERPVARLRSARALPDRNELRWSAGAGAAFTLWRRAEPDPWSVLADVVADGAGTVAFDDRAVEAGAHYTYRLSAPGRFAELAAVDVDLAASTSESIALAAPWPNPSRGALNVSFMTIAAQPAELEVFDVAGRRVWARRWDAPVAGPHHVTIPAGELPRSGLLFVRFLQAGYGGMRRVVMAR